MTECTNCGGTDTEVFSGNLVCTACGAVVSAQVTVSEVQFQENSSGASRALGKFVSNENGSRARESGSSFMTLKNAKYRIERLANQLNLAPFCAEIAFRFYKLALCMEVTKGRNSEFVASACLYLACRQEKVPVMLLDFSDKMMVDVFKLGHTYTALADLLHINLPFLEPCLFIERYARELEFGEKTLEVCRTATRIASRMCRDWMAQGRRPSGICGASLLIAARIHNFNRSLADVMRVVRIGERTIKKRLKEFEQTPSSKLSIEEFNTIDLKESMDPPSYTEGLKRAKLAELEDKGELPALLEEAEELKNEIYKEIEELSQKSRKYKMYVGNTDTTEIVTTSSVAPSMEQLEEELETYELMLADGKKEKLETLSLSNEVLSMDDDDYKNEVFELDFKPVKEDGSEVDVLEDNLDPIRMGTVLALKSSINECLLDSYGSESTKDDGELNLDGIDDEELDQLIRTDEEAKIVKGKWMRENAEYLKELKEKAEKRARELHENPHLAKKRQSRKTRIKTEASSTKEAFERVLMATKLSEMISYDSHFSFDIGGLKRRARESCGLPPEDRTVTERISNTKPRNRENPSKKIKLDRDEVIKVVIEKEEVVAEVKDEGGCISDDDEESLYDEQPDYNAIYEEKGEIDYYEKDD